MTWRDAVRRLVPVLVVLAWVAPVRAQDAARSDATAFTVSGRVVDRDGRPVSGARAVFVPDVLTRLQLDWGTLDDRPGAVRDLALLPRALADAEGRFALTGPRHAWMDAYLLVDGAGRAASLRALAGSREPGAPASIDLGDLPTDPALTVTGRLLDEGGTPVVGARVRLDSDAFGGGLDHAFTLLLSLARTRTDADGRFALTGLPALGRVSLAVDDGAVPGVVASCTLVFALDDAGRPRDAQPAIDVGDLRVERGATLAGRLVDERGAPLAGASVWVGPDQISVGDARGPRGVVDDVLWCVQRLAGDQDARRTSTDAEGRFAFGGLADHAHVLGVVAEGHVPVFVPAVVPGVAQDVEAPTAGALRLRVVDAASGAPVRCDELAVIAASSSRILVGDEPPLPVEPGDDDTLLVRGAGRVRNFAVLRADGYAPQPAALPGVAPGVIVDATVALRRGVLVSGVVRDASGAAVPDYPVGAVTFSPAWPSSMLLSSAPTLLPRVGTTTDAQGRFALRLFPGSMWFVGSETVEAREGEDVGDLVLQLAAETQGRVVGHLRRSDGRPTVGLVTLTALVGGDPEQVGTDGDGAFAFEGVEAGGYDLVAEGGLGVARARVDVVAGETARVDLAFAAGFAVSGRVVGDGSPLPAGRVWMRADGNEVGALFDIRPDGTFRAETPTRDARLQAFTVDGGCSSPLAVRIPDDATSLDDVVLELGHRTCEIALVDGSGAPWHRKPLDVRTPGVPAPTRFVTDAEGRVRLAHLQPGEVEVAVLRFAFGDEALDVRREDGRDEATGADLVRLVVTPVVGEAAAITLRLPSGAPAQAGWTVWACPLGDDGVPRLDEQVYVGSDGPRFPVRSLAPGRWLAVVRDGLTPSVRDTLDDGHTVARQEFLVVAGERTAVDVVLDGALR